MICDSCKQDTDLWIKISDGRKLCEDCFEKRKGVIRGFFIFIVLMTALVVIGITTL